ncbi:MAG: hypothetical protein ACOCXN_01145 [Spirochaetota bacterium]
MRASPGHIVLLSIALLALSATVILIATGITLRRNRRDLVFGLEELDILIADQTYGEASAMVPWLAERAVTAGDGLRVLRRAHDVYDRTADPEPMYAAAQILLDEFPANTTIRTMAVYSAVRSQHPQRALSIARQLETDDRRVFAWALLNEATEPSDHSVATNDGESRELLLARLGTAAPAEPSAAGDFERAWRMTGDQRYALDAVLLLLRAGDLDAGLELAEEAALARFRPILVAGLLIDQARYVAASKLLAAPAPTGAVPSGDSTEIELLLADAYLHTGTNTEAQEIYEALVERERPPLHALLNLAWLAGDEERSQSLILRARDLYPHSWEAARASSLLSLRDGRDLSFDSAPWAGTPFEGRARLLEMRLERDLDRRGYATSLWSLVQEHPCDECMHFAAWYFYTRSRFEDVEMILDRYRVLREGTGETEPSWTRFYRGLLRARDGAWPEAAAEFEASFAAAPRWEAGLNAALALYRTGDEQGARGRLQDALLLARSSPDDRRIAVFIAAAHASRDPVARRALVQEALSIDATSQEALLLAASLGGLLDNADAR